MTSDDAGITGMRYFCKDRKGNDRGSFEFYREYESAIWTGK